MDRSGEIWRGFGWRDMVLPAGLLERTRWRENPLVAYSERRSRRPARFLAARLYEAVILLLCAGFIFMVVDRRMPGYFIPPFFLSVGFLLLRYHLFANDQSAFMKTLSRHHLQELMLTRLSANEFFLHHLLIFCRNYRLVFGFAALTGYYGYLFCVTAHSRASFDSFMTLLMILNVMMQTWLAGIYQYITEWKWFAGGRLPAFRRLISLGLSAGIVIFLMAANLCVIVIGENFCGRSEFLVVGPVAFSLIWAGALALVYHEARVLNYDAMRWLQHRLDTAFDTIPYRLGPLDFVAPWRWASPFELKRRFAAPDFGMLLDGSLYGVLFACSLYAWYWVSRDFSASIDALPRWAILAAMGGYFGLKIAAEGAPLGRDRMKDALLCLGTISILMTIYSGIEQFDEQFGVGPDFVIRNYLTNITCCMIALAMGVVTPGLKRRSMVLGLLPWIVAAVLFVVVAKYAMLGYYLNFTAVRRIMPPRELTGNAWTALTTYFIAYLPTRLILGRMLSKKQ